MTPDIEIRDAVEAAQVGQLVELFATTWWAGHRTAADVERMLAGSDAVFAAVEVPAARPADRLVGFARVLTDGVFLALVLDVIVAPPLRGTGLGAALMDAVLSHPSTAVGSVELVCQPELMPFYRRWAFTEQVGASRLMRRTADPLLVR